jgi:ribose/xylose/arabinose/galactoside ABC-type transport system permease subunit
MTATRPVHGGGRIRVAFLLSHPDATVVATLAVCGVLFGVFASGFASVDNIRSIVISAAVIACIALGENLVILAGEIDV